MSQYNPYAPPGHQPPPPYGGGPMIPGPPITPGIVTERNSAMVVVLNIITCGIYGFYWIYKTSDELKRATGDNTINPTLDLVVSILTCGLWSFYTTFRNAQKVHQLLAPSQPTRKDQSQLILILNIATFVVGVTGLVAIFLTQEELNQLARGR